MTSPPPIAPTGSSWSSRPLSSSCRRRSRRFPRPPQRRGDHSARDVAIVAAVPLTVVVNLFEQAFYAGLAAAAVIEWRAHRPLPSFIPMLRSLPLGRLILRDHPGHRSDSSCWLSRALVFMAYFSISPALVKFEHRGVWGSMRRSRELVRGNFWRADRRRHHPSHRDRGVPDQRVLPRPRASRWSTSRPMACCSRSRASSSWSPHWRCSSCAARRRSRRSSSAPSVTSTSGSGSRRAAPVGRPVCRMSAAGGWSLPLFRLPLARSTLSAGPTAFIGKNCGSWSVIPRGLPRIRRGRVCVKLPKSSRVAVTVPSTRGRKTG